MSEKLTKNSNTFYKPKTGVKLSFYFYSNFFYIFFKGINIGLFSLFQYPY